MQDLAELGATVLAIEITKDDEVVAVVERIAADRPPLCDSLDEQQAPEREPDALPLSG